MEAITPQMQFLSALFANVPTQSYMLIWTLPGKRSAWFNDIPSAALYAEKSIAQDTYVGVGLSPNDNGPRARCKTDNVMGIVGLWADIDVLHKAHKKTNLPPTDEAARALLSSMGMEPSIVVQSGHGLQAWWLFDEPWIFDSPQDRMSAAILSERWTLAIAKKAEKQGWTIDSTFDLARVMRIPGTVNCKHPTEPVVVQLLELTETRYSKVSLQKHVEGLGGDLLANEAKTLETPLRATTEPLEGLRMDSNGHVDIAKFEALCEAEPKFEQSWRRTRKDLKDQTGSSYDLSLATFAVLAGWSNQEIANLILATRQKHNDNVAKAERADYITMTITKARAVQQRMQVTSEQAAALEAIVDSAHMPVEPPSEADKERLHAQALAELGRALGIDIRRLVKYVADPPIYKIETPQVDVKVGTIEFLTSQSKFRDRIADCARVLIPKFKGEAWTGVCQRMLMVCVEEELGEDATDQGKAELWVSEYLRTHSVQPTFEDAYDSGAPFVKDGCILFSGPDLRKWVGLAMSERPSPQQLGAILRTIGAVPGVVGGSSKGFLTTRRVWKLTATHSLAFIKKLR